MHDVTKDIKINLPKVVLDIPVCWRCYMQLHFKLLDGKRVVYGDETEFLVQVGKGKGAYKTRYRIVGNLDQAVMYFSGINVGKGYKKRLMMPSCRYAPMLARQISHE